MNCRLNNAKIKITLTSHFLIYIYQKYLKHEIKLFIEIVFGFNHSL